MGLIALEIYLQDFIGCLRRSKRIKTTRRTRKQLQIFRFKMMEFLVSGCKGLEK